MRKFLDNPQENAGFFSKLIFFWTISLFRKGYSKILQLEDIFKYLDVDKSESLGDHLEKKWNEECKNSKNPSLRKTILRTFWKELSVLFVISFVNDIFLNLAQPLLLGKVLSFFRQRSSMKTEEGAYYAIGLIIVNLLHMLLSTHYGNFTTHYGMKIEIAMSSLLYRKIFRLSPVALNQVTPGKLVNLLSNDMSRFDFVLKFLNGLWTTPLTMLIIMYLLWKEMQWAGIIGLIFAFILIPLQLYSGHLTSIYRLETAKRTDRRVQFMNEIISGAQVIKMYAWEIPFSKLIALARKMELQIIRKNYYVRVFNILSVLLIRKISILCTLIAFTMLYGSDKLTADRVYVMASYLGIFSLVISMTYVYGIGEIAQCITTIKRLKEFLELEEERKQIIHDNNNDEAFTNNKKEMEYENLLNSNKTAPKNITSAKHASSKSRESIDSNKDMDNDQKMSTETITCHSNIEIPQSKLVGIIGPVGSGKSFLLQAILFEKMRLAKTVSYAGQETWIFPGTVRQNILFGEAMDRERYIDVVKASALDKDFKQLEKSDQTVIGERGASLSGGQRARINLARAMYRKADIYLFDDPLSAVDPHVARHIFDKCIGPQSRLANIQATRILVTHQIHFLKCADWIILMREKNVEAIGSPNDLIRKGFDFAKLMGTENKNEEENLSSGLARSLSLTSLNERLLKNKEEIEVPEVQMEESSRGKVKGNIFLSYFTAGSHCSMFIGVFFLFFLTQILMSGSDMFLAYWTKQEELRLAYKNYNEANGEFVSKKLPRFSTSECIYIDASLILVLAVVILLRSLGYFEIVSRASQKLHEKMFSSIICTSMNFFSTNPSGRILNRFSKDIGAVDEVFPKTVIEAIQLGFIIAGSIILTSLGNPISMIPVIILSFFFYFISKVYLRTSNSLKRLEQITKSPVFTHVTTTFEGLTTIKAFKAERMLENDFDQHQNVHTACAYMFNVTRYAFSFQLDLMNSIFIICVILIFFLLDTNATSDQVGLVISQAMGLTFTLQIGIRLIAEIINQLLSIERVLEYQQIKSEADTDESRKHIQSWPSRGEIEYTNVLYRYQRNAEPVLCGISFKVKPFEKIGIVGRTGAGKSSLTGSLFRLAHIEGAICIDGVNTSMVNLHDLRSRISIIPQDPVLFSESIRYNLDPFQQYSDSDIWRALEAVEMKNIAKEGLETMVQANGSNLSVGQRQLICLARAILRKNCILVLDEATANIDPQTDALIQQTIRTNFTECTILTIAHRLHSIIDSDRVLVMDGGRIIEFDTPHVLLQKAESVFRNMINVMGATEARRLSQIAADRHSSIYNIKR